MVTLVAVETQVAAFLAMKACAPLAKPANVPLAWNVPPSTLYSSPVTVVNVTVPVAVVQVG